MTWKWIYDTDVNSLVKQHKVACGMQISKKPTFIINSQIEWKYKNCAWKDVYTDKQFRPVLFKAMKKQSLPHSYLIQTFVNKINIKLWNNFRVIFPSRISDFQASARHWSQTSLVDLFHYLFYYHNYNYCTTILKLMSTVLKYFYNSNCKPNCIDLYRP